MILVKCKCGHFYSISDKTYAKSEFGCPNCGAYLPFKTTDSVTEMLTKNSANGFRVQFISDDVDIEIVCRQKANCPDET